ncbi:MAG: FecR domain-containing protein [Kofleriaceae bacterium]|nr:FecR domain-containing protein [Kofleriaceae bacterium]
MKLLGKIPVEQLDDERLTNIERRIVAGAADAAMRAHAPRSRWFFGAAAATMAVAAALVVGWKLGTSRAPAPIVSEAEPVRVDTTNQRAMLDIGDARIESDAATVFAVTRPGTGVLVELTRGKVELDVDKRGSRDPLVVRAGDTDVIVIGTHFTVDCGAVPCSEGEVDVRVTEGVVEVVRRSQSRSDLRVVAGQTWKTKRGLLAVADAQAADARAAGAGQAIASASTTGTAGGIEIPVGDGPDVLKGRTSAVPTERTKPTLRDPSPTTTPAGKPPRTASTGTGTGSASLDLPTLIKRQPFAPAADIDEPDASKAISQFRQLSTGFGEDASRALYSMAVLQATKLGRTEDALRTLDLFMRRFAHKKEHADALWLRVRILCTRSIDERCRQAAYTYMHEVPGTPAAAIAERITVTE